MCYWQLPKLRAVVRISLAPHGRTFRLFSGLNGAPVCHADLNEEACPAAIANDEVCPPAGRAEGGAAVLGQNPADYR